LTKAKLEIKLIDLLEFARTGIAFKIAPIETEIKKNPRRKYIFRDLI
jgi:hypothetical protein